MNAALREKRREGCPFAVAGRACACGARELLRRGHTQTFQTPRESTCDAASRDSRVSDRPPATSLKTFLPVTIRALQSLQRLRGEAMYGTDENSGLLDANRRRGVGGVPMALQAAMLVTVALALTFLLYHVLALPVDLQMLPSWKWR